VATLRINDALYSILYYQISQSQWFGLTGLTIRSQIGRPQAAQWSQQVLAGHPVATPTAHDVTLRLSMSKI